MKISTDIAQKHWLKAAEEQLTREYDERGYKVTSNDKFGDFYVDLSARKGDELIIIELKTGGWSKQQANKQPH